MPKILQYPKIISEEAHLYDLAMAFCSIWNRSHRHTRPAFKYAVVVVDYFLKYAKAKPLATIFSKKV